MAAVEQHDLEGIVAKRKRDPYGRGVSWAEDQERRLFPGRGRHELLSGDEGLKIHASGGRHDRLLGRRV
jgi:hypothetical protein